MKLTAISFENYKAFQKRESVEIRPLTILIGRNSSGKSIIARLPLQIAHSLSSRAESPLDLEFDGLSFGSSFTDMIHNRLPHGAVGIGANFLMKNGEPFEIFTKIQHFDEYRLQVVTYFKVSHMNLSLSWAGNDPLKDHIYYCKESEENLEGSFQGILPMNFKHIDRPKGFNYASYLDIVPKLFEEYFKPINYLGPFRKEPKRAYLFPGGVKRNVGFGGEKAPELLGDDFLRRKGKVLSAVSDWFSKHLGGWPLDLSSHGDTFSLVLRNPENPSVEVNIADVGTGIAQVLPIIVQRQFEGGTGSENSLEIVEQPELHLHPGAHGDLADLYVDAVKHTGTNFIIETHSENFILRIRRRIAEGKLDSEKAIIYWINDELGSIRSVQPINIKPDGNVDFWPASVFAEDFEEVRAIRRAQQDHKK